MKMKRRKMQWNTAILIVTITLLMIIVNGLNDEEGLERMSMELVHRHDARIIGDVDQVEAIKGFIKRDIFRREMMNQRWGLNHKNNRRKDLEDKEMKKEEEEFQMAMHGGRDYGLGEYFVQVEVGTPGQSFWLIADTGSDLTWFNCKHQPKKIQKKHHRKTRMGTRRRRRRRVKRRSKKNSCDGVFCPRKSHSFQSVKCSSKKCQDLSVLFSLADCPNPSDPCLYSYSYADGSFAEGFFGTETITVNLTNGKKGKLHDLTIGCTKTVLNGISFNEDTSGLLGLGYSIDSFVDKAGFQYGAKFSYCLVDHLSHKNVSSYLTFGNHKVKLLSEMKKTELFLSPPFYGVKIKAISIGDEMLKIASKVWDFDEGGGTIIDSGSSLTSFTLEAYEPVMKTLSKSLTKLKRIEDGSQVMEYCYDSEGFDESVVPRLVFHFGGGVRFEPPVKSYIIDVGPNVKCIGFVAINGSAPSVIGNIIQQNHLWEFDLGKNTLGFAPSACN